jgi:hypothetical protein
MTTRKQIRKAQKTRSLIARTFDAIRNGVITPADVLHQTPACLGRVRVYDVVRRFPHLQGDGAENVLRHAKVWPLKRMSTLTEDERRAILAHLPPRARKL